MKELIFNLDGLYSIKAGIKTVTRRPVRELIPKYNINEYVKCLVEHNEQIINAGITLKIISISEEKLQDITVSELILEGVKTSFKEVWEKLPYRSPYTWDENPNVWRIEFERVKD